MNESITTLKLEDVYPHPRHYRELSEKSVADLAENIRENGQLYPIRVISDGGIHLIVEGHHRHAAMKRIGCETIEAIVLSEWSEAGVSKQMVAGNMHAPETELERSRGIQTMLLLGVRPESVSASAGEDVERVRKAQRGLALAKDYAEDMSLDRLIAVGDFDDDPEAVDKLLTCYEKDWQRVAEDLRRAKRVKDTTARLEAIIAESGAELIHAIDHDTMQYIGRSNERPERAKWGQVVIYGDGGDGGINWYGDASESFEDPAVSAQREERDRIKGLLEEAHQRRLTFVLRYIMGELPGTSNALRDLAARLFMEGQNASIHNIPDEWGEITAFLAVVYASVLGSVERITNSAITLDDWYIQQYGKTAAAYYEALEECGYEVTEFEAERVAALAVDAPVSGNSDQPEEEDACADCDGDHCDDCENA